MQSLYHLKYFLLWPQFDRSDVRIFLGLLRAALIDSSSTATFFLIYKVRQLKQFFSFSRQSGFLIRNCSSIRLAQRQNRIILSPQSQSLPQISTPYLAILRQHFLQRSSSLQSSLCTISLMYSAPNGRQYPP